MSRDAKNIMDRLTQALREVAYVGSAQNMLEWDGALNNVPKNGEQNRADTVAYLSGLSHEKFISKDFTKLLTEAEGAVNEGEINGEEARIVALVKYDLDKRQKLPTEFVVELKRVCSEAHSIWNKARQKSDFSLLAPHLAKIVNLKRKEAEYIGYSKSPYDALMDEFEKDMTSDEVSLIFSELRSFLTPFIDSIKHSQVNIRRDILNRSFPVRDQMRFSRITAKRIGFDFNSGRLNVKAGIHPFCSGFGSGDVVITARYRRHDFLNQCFFSVMHEAGHGMYEQGLPKQYFGTPLGESVSLGVHESNSRMWENIVGRSMPFWQYFYPKLLKMFKGQLSDVSLSEFYKAINYVEPSLIRVDADEVTYNLHIIVRFEIEKDLIEGSIEVNDLPHIWNEKMKEYLGVNVPNDTMGVLQDTHWSDGAFGYFHTYGLGNIYAAQFYRAAKFDAVNMEEDFAEGRFDSLLGWLRKNIHIHGRTFDPKDLIELSTGEVPTPKYLIDYISQKFSQIYEI